MERIIMAHASGTFEVKLTPQSTDGGLEHPGFGRMSIDKQFYGDLTADSQGQMISAGTAIPDSAGYVAMERVSGTLHGRTGAFILQHNATMTRGIPQLSITVVPDSGTDDLLGLAGSMTINIVDGKHFYEFEYTITE
jgi:hypothetical protein